MTDIENLQIKLAAARRLLKAQHIKAKNTYFDEYKPEDSKEFCEAMDDYLRLMPEAKDDFNDYDC